MSSPADTLERVQTTRVCRECGEEFSCEVVTLAGRVSGPTLCSACASLGPPAAVPTDVRPAMEQLGINMREHGSMTLEDIAAAGGDSSSGAAAGKLAEWALAVSRLGPYDWTDGIYLQGPTGTGKSQNAVAAVRLALELGVPAHRIVYDRARDLATTIQDTYGTGGVDKVLDYRRKAAVWVLEDVGSEKHTADSFRIMEALLDRRMGWPNIWTSNDSPEDLEARWADQAGRGRFSSRLAGFRFLTISGEDRRFTRGKD